jgi:hypothetical protein
MGKKTLAAGDGAPPQLSMQRSPPDTLKGRPVKVASNGAIRLVVDLAENSLN